MSHDDDDGGGIIIWVSLLLAIARSSCANPPIIMGSGRSRRWLHKHDDNILRLERIHVFCLYHDRQQKPSKLPIRQQCVCVEIADVTVAQFDGLHTCKSICKIVNISMPRLGAIAANHMR